MPETRFLAQYWTTDADASPEDLADAVRALTGVRSGVRFAYNPVTEDTVEITLTTDQDE